MKQIWVIVVIWFLLNLSRLANGFVIDTQSRETVRNFFNTVYQASENVPSGWTGNITQCLPGTLASTYLEAVVLRVNFFRAMAGVPAAITFDDTYNRKAQQGALMMSANNTIDHNPPSSWSCYTDAGAEAAASSNLSLGSMGPQAVFSQMEDSGSNNAAVGHRRWLLYPSTAVMGSGSVAASANWPATSVLWVFDESMNNARPPTRETFVSWPPSGFVPYQLVFPRWSFSYPEADFSTATVSMQQQDISIPVTLEPLLNPGIGENTLVWVPEIALDTPPNTDMSYAVHISNVLISGISQNFDYTVTVMNPTVLGNDSVFPILVGDTQPIVDKDNIYTFNVVPNATSHQFMQANRHPFTQIEDAENGLGQLTTAISSDYPVIATDVKANGLASFHLAHPEPPSDQILTFKPNFLANENSQLTFSSRLGLASPQQVAKVQVSSDSGQTWQTVFTQAGTQTGMTSSFGEDQFQVKTVSLADFAGSTIQVRFNYAFLTGNYYPQTDAGVGWYLDDIAFDQIEVLSHQTITEIFTGHSVNFNPSQAGDYALQVRAKLYDQYPLEWGPTQRVTAQIATSDNITTTPPIETTTQLPDLGTAIALNAQAEPININTKFTGGMAINGGPFQTHVTPNTTDSVVVRSEMMVDAKHIGETAAIIVVIIYRFPTTVDSAPLLLMLNSEGRVVVWDGHLTSLIPFQNNVVLAATQAVQIYSGQFPTGILNFYWGYRLSDGTVVYNTNNIEAIVTE